MRAPGRHLTDADDWNGVWNDDEELIGTPRKTKKPDKRYRTRNQRKREGRRLESEQAQAPPVARKQKGQRRR